MEQNGFAEQEQTAGAFYFMYAQKILIRIPIFYIITVKARNSPPRCSIKKLLLKIFAIFIGKHLCWSLLLKPITIRIVDEQLVPLMKIEQHCSFFPVIVIERKHFNFQLECP